MRVFMIVTIILTMSAAPLLAAEDGSAPQSDPAAPAPSEQAPSRVFFGGSLGLSFGDYTRFSVSPLVGYRISKMWSAGGRFIYEYIKDKRFTNEVTAHNYGGSLFTRFQPHRSLYLHGEFAYMSYEFSTSLTSTEREWVPFLLLGGGYVQPISSKASFFVEVLVDVLQSDKSPYDAWDPWISAGVVAGF